MLDLRTIETFSMTYIFSDEDGDAAYEYEQIGVPSVAADGLSVSFSLKNIDEEDEDDDEVYSITVVQTADEEFSIKSNYFEDAEELYPMNIELSDEEVCFSSVSENEELYLYGFFA